MQVKWSDDHGAAQPQIETWVRRFGTAMLDI